MLTLTKRCKPGRQAVNCIGNGEVVPPRARPSSAQRPVEWNEPERVDLIRSARTAAQRVRDMGPFLLRTPREDETGEVWKAIRQRLRRRGGEHGVWVQR